MRVLGRRELPQNVHITVFIGYNRAMDPETLLANLLERRDWLHADMEVRSFFFGSGKTHLLIATPKQDFAKVAKDFAQVVQSATNYRKATLSM